MLYDREHTLGHAFFYPAYQAVKNGEKMVVLWGSGRPTRDFLYVEDGARAIVTAMEKYDSPEALNLGSGTEISIKELALMIAKICGFKGKFVWDSAKPDGQPRRCLDIKNAQRAINFKTRVDFRSGLAKTIEWYKSINILDIRNM
ncbi:MAG: NAD-dependent epimerase/dehydratase family protein [Candidatus Omnitrophica bacterium]|nr:NAD-dependent epimerase/dehydratase family protein [Candidatus Omnitrophota bacterium]